ncbi:Protein Smg [Aphis craccivora]|uniref:Protein Smg n=1 Tax=Aphis craccivora TaxID=307492 RepID=A0A6G0VWP2_APHCR|nr:Protein Smg [Aphis craccivora]
MSFSILISDLDILYYFINSFNIIKIEDIMFEILIYLFETYVHSESEMSIDYESLTNDLSDIGFQRKDIYNALRWLKNLSCYKKNNLSSISLASNQISTRIYNQEELNINFRYA